MKENTFELNKGNMSTINPDKKLALIKTFDGLLKSRDFSNAVKVISELILYQEKFLDDPTVLEDQIELMSLSNNLNLFEHASTPPLYYRRAMYDLLIEYQSDDQAWLIERYQELLNICRIEHDYALHYEVSFFLIEHFRAQQNTSELETLYKNLWINIKSLESDLINYAKRVDNIELSMTKHIEDALFYRLNLNPLEHTKRYQMIHNQVTDAVHQHVGYSYGIGFCHVFWQEKKNLLKEKYGLDWHSPSDLNDAHFD